MITERKAEANRLNAQKSTGPKTEAGKERSKVNAVTHGLTRETIDEDIRLSDQFQERLKALESEVQPQTPSARIALEFAVAASLQANLCFKSLAIEVERAKEVARNRWHAETRSQALRWLARLPKNPLLGIAELEGTKAGCGAMIEVWVRLLDALDDHETWTEPELSTAMDLLGVPAHLRFGNSLTHPKDCEDLALHQRSLAELEIERLEFAIEDGLKVGDEAERQRQLMGGGAGSAQSLRLMRYSSAAANRFTRYLAMAQAESTENPPQTSHTPQTSQISTPSSAAPVAEPSVNEQKPPFESLASAQRVKVDAEMVGRMMQFAAKLKLQSEDILDSAFDTNPELKQALSRVNSLEEVT